MKEELLNLFMNNTSLFDPNEKNVIKHTIKSSLSHFVKSRANIKYARFLDALVKEVEGADLTAETLKTYMKTDDKAELVWLSLRSCMISPSRKIGPCPYDHQSQSSRPIHRIEFQREVKCKFSNLMKLF